MKIKKITNFFMWIFVLACLGYFIYLIGLRFIRDHYLEHNAIHTKAVIINNKNYYANDRTKTMFSYSYQFVVNGEKYTGNSHDTSIKVGDSVEVEYNKDHPYYNKPLHPKE